MSVRLALIYGTLTLLLFGAIEMMVGNYVIPTFGQITPTKYPDNEPSDDNNGVGSSGPKTSLAPTGSIPSFGQITPTPYPYSGQPSDDNNGLGSSGPKTTLAPTGSNFTESQPISGPKYSKTTDDGSSQETLGEKIFSKVNEDLKASGITEFYP